MSARASVPSALLNRLELAKRIALDAHEPGVEVQVGPLSGPLGEDLRHEDASDAEAGRLADQVGLLKRQAAMPGEALSSLPANVERFGFTGAC